MRKRLTFVIAGTALSVLVLMPTAARAEGYVSPWAGVQFGHDADNGRGAFGVTAGGMGAGIVGGEVDLGYSPRFFGNENDFGNNTVIDVMGNIIVGIPVGGTHGGGVRPFVTGGVGLIRTQIDGGTIFKVSSSSNQFGWNAGAGVMGFFGDHFGLRGDVRYFRDFQGDTIGTLALGTLDLGQLHFWRASLGVVFR